MASVTTFIRNTPVASLRTYFDTTGIELPTPMNWDADAPDVIEAKQIKKAQRRSATKTALVDRLT